MPVNKVRKHSNELISMYKRINRVKETAQHLVSKYSLMNIKSSYQSNAMKKEVKNPPELNVKDAQ